MVTENKIRPSKNFKIFHTTNLIRSPPLVIILMVLSVFTPDLEYNRATSPALSYPGVPNSSIQAIAILNCFTAVSSESYEKKKKELEEILRNFHKVYSIISKYSYLSTP